MNNTDKFCEIINKAFAYPFMPEEFVHAEPSPYPNGIRLQIGSRDVSFTLDGEWMGQDTKPTLRGKKVKCGLMVLDI